MVADTQTSAEYALQLMQRIQAGAPLNELRELLEPGWTDPEALNRSLYDLINAHGPSLSSLPGMSANPYQDLVGRHVVQNSTAMVYRDPIQGWRQVTYRELHAESGRLAATWSALGVETGQRIAVVMPVGGPMALCLMTGLRMGLIVSFIPPLGRAFVQTRLQAAGTDWQVLAAGYPAWLGADPELLLPPVPEAGVVAELGLPAHSYGPEDPALCLFSAMGPTPAMPLERPAQALLSRVAIDAEVVLGLGPTDRVMAPEYSVLQHQPALMLTTFFAGACWVEAPSKALEDETLAKQLAPTVVGVTPALRDRIMQGHLQPKGWRRWFKNPSDAYDWMRWQRFAEQMTALDAWGQNLVVSSAYGGSILFCPPQPEAHLEVLPSPALPWMLAESTLNQHPSSSDSGIFCCSPQEAPEGAMGRFLVGDGGEGFFIAGSADEGRGGTTYLDEEVVAVAQTHPAVDAASIVINRGVRVMNQARVVLMLFVDPGTDPSASKGRLIEEMQELLRVEMGPEQAPDQIRVYPLTPKNTEEGSIDHNWCRWQFLTGELQTKSDDELFRLSSLARRQVQLAIEEL